MPRTISTITVHPMTSLEAYACVESFGTNPNIGELIKGVKLSPDLSALPLRWTLRIDRSCDAFDIILMQLSNDPRVHIE